MAVFSPCNICLCAYTLPCSYNSSKRFIYTPLRAECIVYQPCMTGPIYPHPRSLVPQTAASLSKQRHSHFNLVSSYSNSNSTLSDRNRLIKPLIEFAIKLLIGSLIVTGSLKIKPAIALSSRNSVVTEEERVAENGKIEDDEELYLKLLKEEPRNVDALKVLVNLKMRKGSMKAAVKYVEELIDIEPDEIEWRLLQALCYEMMGQLSKAKRLFKEILKERPLLLRALHIICTGVEDIPNIATLRCAIFLYFDFGADRGLFVSYRGSWGLAMVMHKNLEGPAVFETLNNALELACHEKRVTEERNIRILIAQMHVVQGELDKGLKKFQALVNDNPRDFRPYLCQGIIYSLQDKKKEAEEQFEIYQKLVPDEFPQRGFLDDVVLTAKTESRQKLEKQFKSEFSHQK